MVLQQIQFEMKLILQILDIYYLRLKATIKLKDLKILSICPRISFILVTFCVFFVSAEFQWICKLILWDFQWIF